MTGQTEDRLKKIREIEKHYLDNHVEDPIDGSRFDCSVLDACEAMRDQVKSQHSKRLAAAH